jgi:hypothetical protein
VNGALPAELFLDGLQLRDQRGRFNRCGQFCGSVQKRLAGVFSDGKGSQKPADGAERYIRKGAQCF